jgi:Caspase domain
MLKRIAHSLAAIGMLLSVFSSVADAEPLIFHASQSGKPTLDEGEGGGNPFASSLIELLRRPALRFANLGTELSALTFRKSNGFQSADVPRLPPQQSWSLVPAPTGERRRALVLVFSDYEKSGGAPSLPGAKHDADRIAVALKNAGFDVQIAIDQDLAATRATLSAFASRSANDDISVIYATGHGVEVDGTVFLVPGDYPIAAKNSKLRTHALKLSAIASSGRARRANLVFYGGCRDNPFGN